MSELTSSQKTSILIINMERGIRGITDNVGNRVFSGIYFRAWYSELWSALFSDVTHHPFSDKIDSLQVTELTNASQTVRLSISACK